MTLARIKQIGFGALVVAALTCSGLAQEELRQKVKRHRLANGMTFLLLERHVSPTVSFHIYYDVGAVDEPIGQTGIAHMYEHMAFKGTRTLGTRNYAAEVPLLKAIDEKVADLTREKDKRDGRDAARIAELETQVQQLQKEHKQYVVDNEIGTLYERHGGSELNASTAKDSTEYYISLPANKIELWAAIESDRMTNPVLREFYTERDVVKEERRMRIETQPVGKLLEQYIVTAFDAHPYGLHSGVGWMSDLDHLTRAQTEDFFKRYYNPANTIIAIVGDFKTAELIALLERYFSRVPSAPKPPRIHTIEPEQKAEKRVTLFFPSNPFVLVGYHRTDVRDPDDYVFDVIQNVMANGRTARLYRSLIEEKKVALGAEAIAAMPLTYGKYPTLFTFFVVPQAPHTPEEAEKALYEEIEKLKTTPVDARELQKNLNQIDAGFIRRLRSNSSMASSLAMYEALTGDWAYMVDYRARVAKVGAADIQRVARKYFTQENRTVTILQPPAAAAAPAIDLPAPSAEAAAQARTIIEKALEAKGGKAALEKVISYATTSDITLFTPQGELKAGFRTVFAAPDKFHAELQAAQFSQKQVFNGKTGWIQVNGQTQEAPPPALKNFKMTVKRDHIQLLLRAAAGGYQMLVLPDLELEGKTYHAILMKDAEGDQFSIYFDKSNYLIGKVDYATAGPGGAPVIVDERYGDYRELSGIQVPFSSLTLHTGEKFSERKVQKIEFNIPVDAKLFEKP
ncbi:MAG: M16 family metallopeptidase [Acidobacteriota bacterium]